MIPLIDKLINCLFLGIDFCGFKFDDTIANNEQVC